ncbi:hypothetical protein V6Z12_D11G011700 [Gossypium hirsutum]
MASGFSGGGPDFYGGLAGRSVGNTGTINNNQTTAPYRTQVPGMFMDTSSQIVNRATPGFIGKRTLADFQTQQALNNNSGRLFLRSRYGLPLLQQLRPQQVPLGINTGATIQAVSTGLSGGPYMNQVSTRVVQPHDPEKKMMNQLQDLEKQLLDDDNDEGDAVSDITNINSEWSETIQNLIGSTGSPNNPIAPSPTSTTSSCSSTSSTASPASPCSKQTILDAAAAISEGKNDVVNEILTRLAQAANSKGGQYMNLLHALSERGNGKPATVKITAIADNGGDERLKTVGDRLSQFAESYGVSLKFNVISGLKLSDLSRDSLGIEQDEPLAVNFAFKLYRMPDESVSIENPRDELLRRVKGLAPRVLTLVEQEMNTNTAPFASRVGEACGYYGALFDSVESTVLRDNPDRAKLEEGLLRKIANSVACEGRDRVERCEVFGKWRARMSMAGFELKPLSQTVAETMRAKLNSGNRVNPGFTVKEENGGVNFGWLGRTLTVASAWR